MRISFLPETTSDRTSSRVRVYSLQWALNKLGIDTKRGYFPNSDALVIQKKTDPQVIDIVRKARNEGALVIYDTDEPHLTLTYLQQLTEFTDLITTDTAGHKAQLHEQAASIPVEIVPSPIDYFPMSPVRLPPRSVSPLRILFLGDITSENFFDSISDSLLSLHDIELVVVLELNGSNEMRQQVLAQYASKYPRAKFLEYSKFSFIQVLQMCHISCLAFDRSNVDPFTSNRWMITSIAWGVPSVVSNTIEYERTAKEIGIDYAIFSNVAELYGIIDTLRSPQTRAVYMAAAQSEVWLRYSPESVAKVFLNKLSGLKSPRISSTEIQTILRSDRREAIRINRNPMKQFRRWARKHMPYPIKVMLAPYVSVLSADIYSDTRRVPPQDYQPLRFDPTINAYQMGIQERLRQQGSQVLETMPLIDVIKTALRVHTPTSVLQIGCGHGHILSELSNEFNVVGCDGSSNLLRSYLPGLNVFEYDIAQATGDFEKSHLYEWETVFLYGVMRNLMTTPLQTAYTMNNLLLLASKKIIVWDWPEVCLRMQQFSDSPKFEYHQLDTKMDR